eukprot:g14994.t1
MSRNQTISLEALDEFGRGTRQHMEFRIAPVGVVYTQATQAHLRRTGCRSGDETELDTFGMGKRFDFMQQYVSFKDLLTFRSHLDREVSVTTCMDGEKKQHRLSLKWNTSRFEGGIRYLYEPNFDQTAKDYEPYGIQGRWHPGEYQGATCGDHLLCIGLQL